MENGTCFPPAHYHLYHSSLQHCSYPTLRVSPQPIAGTIVFVAMRVDQVLKLLSTMSPERRNYCVIGAPVLPPCWILIQGPCLTPFQLFYLGTYISHRLAYFSQSFRNSNWFFSLLLHLDPSLLWLSYNPRGPLVCSTLKLDEISMSFAIQKSLNDM